MARKRDQDFLPAVRRARYERLTIFEVTEAELDQLERGSPESIFLNFAIFCLSVFVSFLVTLLTTETHSIYVFVVFVVITVVTALAGTILLILWFSESIAGVGCDSIHPETPSSRRRCSRNDPPSNRSRPPTQPPDSNESLIF